MEHELVVIDSTPLKHCTPRKVKSPYGAELCVRQTREDPVVEEVPGLSRQHGGHHLDDRNATGATPLVSHKIEPGVIAGARVGADVHGGLDHRVLFHALREQRKVERVPYHICIDEPYAIKVSRNIRGEDALPKQTLHPHNMRGAHETAVGCDERSSAIATEKIQVNNAHTQPAQV